MQLLKLYFLFFCTCIAINTSAQTPYMLGNVIKNFSIHTLLNHPKGVTTISQLQSDLTILDFFGTWCAPCIKALPHLQDIKQRFGDSISIILISTEEEMRLQAFIQQHATLSFPLIVDNEQLITPLFQPPSYPYTVVFNRERKIVSISNAAALTINLIENWLNGTRIVKSMAPTVVATEVKPTTGLPITNHARTSNRFIQLSQDFMYAAKTNSNTDKFRTELQQISYDSLVLSLKSDNEKKAFWINIYNGFTQYLLKNNLAAYQKRGQFYKAKQINIAGKILSLDEIEHGFLRHSKIKWSEGYLNKLFPSKTEKQLRVAEVDYRIHFSLNCGAESCPPIAFYDDENINSQLNVATRGYLSTEAKYDAADNSLQLPKLMSWFRHDFRGKGNMLLLVKKLGIVPVDKKPKIHFKPYSWNLYLDNYKN